MTPRIYAFRVSVSARRTAGRQRLSGRRQYHPSHLAQLDSSTSLPYFSCFWVYTMDREGEKNRHTAQTPLSDMLLVLRSVQCRPWVDVLHTRRNLGAACFLLASDFLVSSRAELGRPR